MKNNAEFSNLKTAIAALALVILALVLPACPGDDTTVDATVCPYPADDPRCANRPDAGADAKVDADVNAPDASPDANGDPCAPYSSVNLEGWTCQWEGGPIQDCNFNLTEWEGDCYLTGCATPACTVPPVSEMASSEFTCGPPGDQTLCWR